MLTLALAWALGQISMAEAPLPGIVIGNVTPFTGRAATNFVHADVDGDGEADLLLPGLLYLQRNGMYDGASPIAMPAPGGEVHADVFAGALYLRSRDRLWVHTFEDGAWRTTLEQALDSPGAQSGFDHITREGPGFRFQRFLHDLDGSGTPELVTVDQRGAHLFRLRDGRYAPAGTIPLPAPIAGNFASPQALWPPGERRIRFPEQQMSSRLLFDGQTLLTLSIAERRKDLTRYALRAATVEFSGEGNFTARERPAPLLDPLPAHLRPCRLNEDGMLAFAGGRWLRSDAGPVPTAIYELWATLDGGETFHVRRAAAYTQFRPHCAFVDFDGSGDMDMVLESTQWPRSSLREQLNRFLTESRIEHTILIYRQRKGTFSEKPDVRHTVEITLEAPPARPGTMLARYEAGTLVNVTGDFDGDGFRDLLVRTAPDRLQIHRATGWGGFESRPAWTLAIAPDMDAQVADLNGNGLSDLYIRPRDQGATGLAQPGTAYYAGGAGP